MIRTIFVLLLLPFALMACEQLGIDDPVKVAERQDAEGRAVGSGCRHSGRPLEECYSVNKRASKAAIFAGWREMDGYMRENQMETAKSAPEEAEPDAKAAKAADKTEGATDKTPDKTPAKTADKATEKAGEKETAAPQGDQAEKKPAAKGKKTAVLHGKGRLT